MDGGTASRASSGRAARSSDLAVVRAALSGDARHAAALRRWLRCVPRVASAWNDRHGEPIDARDLQDVAGGVLACVVRGLPDYDGRTSLPAWAHRVAVRELARARAPHGRAAERFELRAELDRALEALPEELDLVVRLRHLDDLSFEAIAARMGSSVRRVKERYVAAFRALEEGFGESEP